MPLRRLPSISSTEPSTPPAVGVASLEEVKDKKNSLEKSWQDSKQVRNSGLIDWESYECQLVTPLFGGGVVAGQVDQRMPIRASAIRGQLRFWWRLLASKRLNNPEKIRAEEFALWGGLGTPPQASRVWVEVEKLTPQPTLAPWAKYEHKLKSEDEFKALPTPEEWAKAPYALFPLQGKKPKRGEQEPEIPPGKLAKPPFKWTLHIGLQKPDKPKDKSKDKSDEPHLPWTEKEYAYHHEHLQKALRWWANFGGVGARTRRGLGAVHIDGLEAISAQDIIDAGCTLVLTKQAHQTAQKAWVQAIQAMQSFRQGTADNQGRNPGRTGTRPGRSRWPEADAIRRMTGYQSPKHAPAHKAGNVFPRAVFGMPIIFHFNDYREYIDKEIKNLELPDEVRAAKKRETDPANFSLQPVGCERLASPVILRPIKQGQTWRAAALLLPYEKILDLAVTQPDGTVTNPGEWWDAAQFVNIPPMHAQKQSHPLLAFLQYFETYSNQATS